MKIVIYSTPICPFCVQEKDFLKQHHVAFEDLDVSTNPEAGEEMIDKTKQMGVPVTVITKDDGTEEIIIGFQKDRLSKILGI